MNAGDTTVSAEDTVRDYYRALSRGEPLFPYFHADEATVKVGVSESLYGPDEIANGLREQTETTTDWVVESDRLRVDERAANATFGDEVRLAWTDTESGVRRQFDTRWSGTLLRVDERWAFVTMHVSTAGEV